MRVKPEGCSQGLGLLGVLLLLSSPLAAAEVGELREPAQAHFSPVAPVTPDERDDPQVALGRALFWDEGLLAHFAAPDTE